MTQSRSAGVNVQKYEFMRNLKQQNGDDEFMVRSLLNCSFGVPVQLSVLPLNLLINQNKYILEAFFLCLFLY